MTDQFFTPSALAEFLVNSVKIRKIELVGDFAAGHGDLLVAARSKWKECFTLGSDIDDRCVRVLREEAAIDIHVRCDFLRRSSRNSSSNLRSRIGTFDLVLLNPPFSGKGGAIVEVVECNDVIKCSRAMAFIHAGLSYLRSGGELLAILPSSCLTSVKDEKIRNVCRNHATMSVVQKYSRTAFPECAASTVVVRYRTHRTSQKALPSETPNVLKSSGGHITVKIIRGCLPVYRAENGRAGSKYPFVHSTDIDFSKITQLGRSVDFCSRIVRGPAVLVTRVGSPKTQKCAVYRHSRPIALSDCVIALTCRSISDAKKVQDQFRSNWASFSTLFTGTGAPYITLQALEGFLTSISIKVEHDEPTDWTQTTN